MERIVIFGATSAIAQAAARLWAARGASLYLIGRNEDKLAALVEDLQARGGGRQVFSRQADLADSAGHEELVATAWDALGGVDVALIAHGTLPDQKACEVDPARTLAEINTNGLSVISLMSILANRLEVQKKGCIAVITSVAGDRGRQSNYVYGAAKGMVTIFASGLRNRLAAAGVDVVAVKPGFVATPMTAAFDRSGPLWAQPADIARGIVSAIDHGRDVVYLPWFWRWIMVVIRSIPERVFKRLHL